VYFILEESAHLDSIDPWSSRIADGFRVFGYSWIGDFFLVSVDAASTGILRTHSAAFDELGVPSAEEFRDKFLTDPGIIESVADRNFKPRFPRRRY